VIGGIAVIVEADYDVGFRGLHQLDAGGDGAARLGMLDEGGVWKFCADELRGAVVAAVCADQQLIGLGREGCDDAESAAQLGETVVRGDADGAGEIAHRAS
jgi:hypothetical protein